MTCAWTHNLLPEEDALDDPEEDDETDLTLPGDLWFRAGRSADSLRDVPPGPLTSASYTASRLRA
jgi:hypothetical protein